MFLAPVSSSDSEFLVSASVFVVTECFHLFIIPPRDIFLLSDFSNIPGSHISVNQVTGCGRNGVFKMEQRFTKKPLHFKHVLILCALTFLHSINAARKRIVIMKKIELGI